MGSRHAGYLGRGQSAEGAGQATKTRGVPAIRRLAISLPARLFLLSTMYRRYGWYLTHGLISILLFVSCFPFSIFFSYSIITV